MGSNLRKDKIYNILKISKELNFLKDIDSLLDHVLMEARDSINADAGTIYLTEGNQLTFNYFQNDTLFKKDMTSKRYIYSKQKLEINHNSIAGYVAETKKPLIINDVYKVKATLPYSFNPEFDKKSSYKTKTVLTVPLITARNKLIGIMQIINPKNKKGLITSFTKNDTLFVTYFASHAAVAIEKAIMTREIILRMIKMSEMRDPKETGPHVNRVGAYSIEIYHKWALDHRISSKDIKTNKDLLRIAAMLHDVGKIGVSDIILKKEDNLSDKEFSQMKMHTIFGARLFKDSTSDWDDMAKEITINHHERWDGKGYPGHINNIFKENIVFGPGKKREEIPLSGRIVALADVYDALTSSRIYKQPWSEQSVMDYIEKERGAHFDPSVVDAFFSIYDIIKAIQEKYSY